jgi:aspartyl-tRNA(Asn)/glutamyl-tRNA(Gln) amidotransferase subunit A
VSTYGLIPASWYQDTAGPLARTVADCALILNAVAGHDPLDPMSARLPVPDYTAVLDGEVRGLRIGLVQEPVRSAHLDPEVKARVLEAVKVFERLGATVEEVSVPLMVEGGLINGALGSSRTALHWRYLTEAAADYDAGVRLYTVLPGLIPAALYQRALQLRSLLRAQVLAATERFDVLISPAYPAPPPRIEDTKSPPRSKEQAVEQMHKFSYTAPANYAGLPAISVPAGFSEKGLPIGLQIMAKRFDEESVFRAAHAFEVATPWHAMRPPVGDD